jgi:hypothetical protein
MPEKTAFCHYFLLFSLFSDPFSGEKCGLGLLRKPVALRKPIAIPLCNAKYGVFLRLESLCNNLRLRNAQTGPSSIDLICR